MPHQDKQTTGILKTLDSALSLLTYFDAKHQNWGVRELSKAAGMNSSVVQRMLATLAKHQFLARRTQTRKYSLGMSFLKYAQIVREGFQLSEYIFPTMRAIAEETGETVFLSFLDGQDVVVMEIAESRQSIKHTVRVGTRTPLNAGAFAKVILAYLPESFYLKITESDSPRFTKKTTVERAALEKELKKIRQQEWSSTTGEYSEGVFGIAVPIFVGVGNIVGSLCISGPEFRLTKAKVKQFVQLLVNVRPQIESALSQALL